VEGEIGGSVNLKPSRAAGGAQQPPATAARRALPRQRATAAKTDEPLDAFESLAIFLPGRFALPASSRATTDADPPHVSEASEL
jgi:hypothetical protein